MNTRTTTPRTVRPSDVKIGTRQRKDLGDLDELASSIDALGLLAPIAIDTNGNLVAGQRRVTAWQMVHGNEPIPAHVLESVADAEKFLAAERDENTLRKPFLPTEAVNLGLAIEAIEKPKARTRRGGRPKTGGNVPADTEPTGRVRDLVAPYVGLGARSYEKAKAVVQAADDPNLDAEARHEAQAAAIRMDETGNIDRAYRTVQRLREPPTAAGPAIGAEYEREITRTIAQLQRLAAKVDPVRVAREVDEAMVDKLDDALRSAQELATSVHDAQRSHGRRPTRARSRR